MNNKNNIKFSWDEAKNARNIAKHGVSFEEAKHIFSDPNTFEIFDSKHNLDEDRWKIIGMNGWGLFTVICTEDEDEEDETIRIISARKADKKEKEVYFYGYSSFYTG